MRLMVVLALAVGVASAQEAVNLPGAGTMQGVSVESFRFVSDGPIGPGWSRPDEIARKYFHDDLTGLFERTIVLNDDVPARTKLVWIFTGPRAGFTVELSATKVRVFERYYDSMGMYASGSYPEKIVRDEERMFTGHARTLTVVADKHLAVRVLVNGMEVLTAPMLFDVTRHQLMYAAPRIEHEVVEGALLRPSVKVAVVTMTRKRSTRRCWGLVGALVFRLMRG